MAITDSGMERKTAAVARGLPKENKNHDGGEKQTDATLAQHRGNGLLDEERLIKFDVGFQLRRNVA